MVGRPCTLPPPPIIPSFHLSIQANISAVDLPTPYAQSALGWKNTLLIVSSERLIRLPRSKFGFLGRRDASLRRFPWGADGPACFWRAESGWCQACPSAVRCKAQFLFWVFQGNQLFARLVSFGAAVYWLCVICMSSKMETFVGGCRFRNFNHDHGSCVGLVWKIVYWIWRV